MPKRTIESFFAVQKRPKASPTAATQVTTAAQGSNDCVAAATAASQQAMWGSAAPRSPAQPVAEAPTDVEGAAPAGEAEPAAAAAAASVAEPGHTEAEEAPTPEMLAKWHADADRNLEAAREVVAAAQAAGTCPKLDSLLVEQSWLPHMRPEFDKQYFRQLQRFLASEWQAQQVFPPPEMVFRAMNSTSFDKVKVVILGQDPYHNTGQAMGLSFSVPQGVPVPSSLQNIYKELNADLGCSRPKHGCLLKWAEQGVLMLNASLTVRAHNANSHKKKGWETFTDKAISAISKHRTGVVFLLWGASAQSKESLINASKHHVLKCAHPSGLSANKGFFGCKHFSKTNKLLEKAGMAPIDWQIE